MSVPSVPLPKSNTLTVSRTMGPNNPMVFPSLPSPSSKYLVKLGSNVIVDHFIARDDEDTKKKRDDGLISPQQILIYHRALYLSSIKCQMSMVFPSSQSSLNFHNVFKASDFSIFFVAHLIIYHPYLLNPSLPYRTT